MPAQEEPRLSVVVVAGPMRARVQRTLEALASQRVAGGLDVVVVDLAEEDAPPLELDGMRLLALPGSTDLGAAKAAAVRAASGDYVAFLEDHTAPLEGWAEAVLAAHAAGPWAAVGFAYVTANPERWLSRSLHVGALGQWAHPARSGPVPRLPGGNNSYRRDLLLGLGERLEHLFAVDFNVHEALLAGGHGLYLEAGAVVVHANHTHFRELFPSHFAYCRVLGADRAAAGGWSGARRLAYGLATPVVVPTLRFGRLVRSLRGRPALWGEVVAGLPLIALSFGMAAIGESAGYLFGPGGAPAELARWELEAGRGEE